MRAALFCLAVLPLVALGAAGAVVAQGSEDMSSRAQSHRAGEGPAGDGARKAQVAHVGAGTTNGSTTGFSGPDSGGGSLGETELPPVPNAELCRSYQDGPAYRGCLWIVLGQKPEEH